MSPWQRSGGPADTIRINGVIFDYVQSYKNCEDANGLAQAIRDDGLKARVRKWQSVFETLYVVYEEAEA